ncbi:ATP-binding protein [Shewanella fidelis]|uniref:ATP-binding protein n=1 Tax=Shewanella fidelis TaxID=173509 RepID=UPI0004B0496E|nr:ATP-binding protein [Shewanella fidelis]
MRALSYQQKSYGLVFMALVAVMLLVGLLAKLSLVQQYQYAYTELSHQVLLIRDQVFKVKVSDNQSYDNLSQSLVRVERQVQHLQQLLQEPSSVGASMIVDNAMQLHANEFSLGVENLVANLETLLRLKISQEYSTHTVSLLQQELLGRYADAESKMYIFALIAGTPQVGITHSPVFTTSQYQSLAVHSELLVQLDEQIKLKSQQVFDTQINSNLAVQARFWLTLVDDIKFYLLLVIFCLLLIFAINYRVQQREQNRKESKIRYELSESEKEKAQLSLVAEHAQDAIIITDDTGRVTWVNKGFVNLSGYSPEEIKGKKPGAVLQGENTSKHEVDRIRQGIMRQESIKSELINYHKDGSEYWIDIAINPILDPEGKLTNYIAVERDSTERKQMQSELEQAVIKADVSNKAKSTFLATMSHELRTPLNGILGMAQIIEPSLENPEHRQQIRILLESGNHLTSLLNDILDFSKVEEGKLCLEDEPFQLSTVIDPIISTYSPICAEKNIGFEVKNSINPAQSFRGDKARVRQIIYNLLSNSVKFTQSGRITLSFSQALGETAESGIAIVIQDSGIGIRKDRLESIFDPFTQAESSTTRQYGGTGLGLSIVKQLVELMGGKIQVSSQIGLGTRFDIFIALERAKNVTYEIDTQPVTQVLPEKLRILIAEDNKVNALVAKTFCQRLGHTVEIAYNGLEAINILKHRQFELIIMDNHMPEMDGIEATEYIRKTLKLSVPVFACTADVFKEAHDNMIQAGANHVLTKPLQEQSFRDALSQFAHLINKPQGAATVDNKVVALSRHQPQELNTTEADIDYRQLRALVANDAHRFSLYINEFNEFAEASITKLISAYDADNAADIYQLSRLISDKAESFFSARIQTLSREIADTLEAGDSVLSSQLELERLQHLINLLEVNIHQNQRLLQEQSNDSSTEVG